MLKITIPFLYFAKSLFNMLVIIINKRLLNVSSKPQRFFISLNRLTTNSTSSLQRDHSLFATQQKKHRY